MTSSTALPLKDKLAIVTGASRGLGVSVAWELASRGADVCLTHVSPGSRNPVSELASKIQALSHQPKAYICQSDLSSPEGPQTIISSLLESRGPQLAIHILVNNAAFLDTGSLSDISLSDYDKIFNLNVRGVMLMAQAVLPYLQPKGRVINMSSVGAREGLSGLSLYCGAKGALEAMTRCWAAELGQNGTTVNCVNPGPTQSEMLEGVPKDIVEQQKSQTPIENRVGQADEVARVVAFLASEDASWVTGQAISASGGYAMY